MNWQTFKYNTLETLYLSTAMFILLSGTCELAMGDAGLPGSCFGSEGATVVGNGPARTHRRRPLALRAHKGLRRKVALCANPVPTGKLPPESRNHAPLLTPPPPPCLS